MGRTVVQGRAGYGEERQRPSSFTLLSQGRNADHIFFLPLSLSHFRRFLLDSTRLAPKMKDIYKEEVLDIPEGVTVSIKSRVVTVVGPRGTLVKVRI